MTAWKRQALTLLKGVGFIAKSKIDSISDESLLKLFDNSKSISDLYKLIGYTGSGSISKENNDKLNKRLSCYGKSLDSIRKCTKTTPNNCLYCNSIAKNKFCSYRCKNLYYNEIKLKKWKETGNTGVEPSTTIRGVIRQYIYEKQNYKCAICGSNNYWNNKPLNFILDHIDGDASNGNESNLRLVCPNCDSQLPTFKSKNKNSARSFRTKRNMCGVGRVV